MPDCSTSMQNSERDKNRNARPEYYKRPGQTEKGDAVCRRISFFSVSIRRLLSWRDSAHRAYISTRAAVYTYARVDLVDVALADSA